VNNQVKDKYDDIKEMDETTNLIPKNIRKRNKGADDDELPGSDQAKAQLFKNA